MRNYYRVNTRRRRGVDKKNAHIVGGGTPNATQHDDTKQK